MSAKQDNIVDKMYYYDLCRTAPEEAKKKITGGRLSGMTDINPMWRIKKLTELFGACGIGWYYLATNKWTEAAENEVTAFADIELYIKNGDEWSKPIHGTGGSKLATKEKGGIYVSDECYKMATTDALSVACKQLGIGADVYFAKDNTKYNQPIGTVTLGDIDNLYKEIIRTGVSHSSVRERYKRNSISEMTKTEIDSAIRTFSKMQTCPEPCPVTPGEPEIDNPHGLPFV